MTRLLRRAHTLPGAPAVGWRDRRRLAKKRARGIEYSCGSDNERQLYGELIAAARASRAELQALAAELTEIAGTAAKRWRATRPVRERADIRDETRWDYSKCHKRRRQARRARFAPILDPSGLAP